MFMDDIYKEFITKLKAMSGKNKATVVYLQGDLGSGKTTFTKNLCENLGLEIDITSPTFTILKSYEFPIENFKKLIHIDAYRLNSYEDLLKIKIEEYLRDKENLIFIEWPSIIENDEIKPDMIVRFDYVEDINRRSIKID
jgi:tRNA threonylcarbamoyladenosine biosynthesis protein TsaE